MSLPSRVRNPLLGRHVTSVIITPLTIAENGGNTAGTPVDVSAILKGLDDQTTVEHERIETMNGVLMNNVKISEGKEVTLEILKVNDGTAPDKLAVMVATNDYFRIVWVEGTGGSAATRTLYGLRGNSNHSLRGRGEQIATLTLVPADFGASTFATA